MSEFLLNPWITGVGGGILSGLIVFIITRWLFSDQSKKELSQKVLAANREIIYAIRAGIPEGLSPTVATMDSLRSATARRNELPSEFLLSNSELIDELVKEVMDNSFISAATKNEYCTNLHKVDCLLEDLDADGVSLSEERQRAKSASSNEGAWLATSSAMAVMAGLMVAITTTFSADVLTVSGPVTSVLKDLPSSFLIPLGAVAVALVASMFALLVSRKTEQQIREKELERFRANIKKMEATRTIAAMSLRNVEKQESKDVK